METLDAFHRFTRPHTMIGTLLSVTSVSIMAMSGGVWDATAWSALLLALTAALLANISIVGINQCFDVDIDRVNKPYLPMASGEFSMSTGWWIVIVTGVLSLAIAVATGSIPLIVTVAGSHVLGICYSVDLPLFRWKRFPVLAAGCILAVRAVLVQIGFWAHMRVMTDVGAASSPLVIPTNVLFMSAFMLWFSIVIALFKDIPDAKGDKRANIRTATLRFGVPRVFWVCMALLLLAYACAVAYCALFCSGWARVVAIGTQLVCAAALLQKASQTDLGEHAALVEAYMFIWKLFYAQYLVIPLLA